MSTSANDKLSLSQSLHTSKGRQDAMIVFGVGLALLAFLALQPVGPSSVLRWAWSACNSETDYLHGRFVPVLILLLLWIARGKIKSAPVEPRNIGILGIVAGLILLIVATRAQQPRIALAGFPLLTIGAVTYVWGWSVARHIVFPACLVYFAIPIPGMLQMTTKLQIVATQTAYGLSNILGCDVIAAGNIIRSASGSWDFDIAEGCSGIRSLVALTLIAAIYGHFVLKSAAKKILLLFSSVIIALVANGIRVTSIVLVAEYLNPEIASAAYHSFSGLLFIPLGISGIVVFCWILNGGLTKKRSRGERTTYVGVPSAPSNGRNPVDAES